MDYWAQDIKKYIIGFCLVIVLCFALLAYIGSPFFLHLEFDSSQVTSIDVFVYAHDIPPYPQPDAQNPIVIKKCFKDMDSIYEVFEIYVKPVRKKLKTYEGFSFTAYLYFNMADESTYLMTYEVLSGTAGQSTAGLITLEGKLFHARQNDFFVFWDQIKESEILSGAEIPEFMI